MSKKYIWNDKSCSLKVSKKIIVAGAEVKESDLDAKVFAALKEEGKIVEGKEVEKSFTLQSKSYLKKKDEKKK